MIWLCEIHELDLYVCKFSELAGEIYRLDMENIETSHRHGFARRMMHFFVI